LAESFDGISKPLLELFSLEKEEAALLPGGLFVLFPPIRHVSHANCNAILSSCAARRNSSRLAAYHLLRVCWQNGPGEAGPEEKMFCDGCGAAVQPGQAYCSRCGKQVVGLVTAMQARRNRVQEHVHLLGILWLAISAFNTIGAVVVFIVANTLFPHLHELGAPPQVPTNLPHMLLSVIAVFILAKAACGFITGWGLLQREPWARVLALVMGFLSLFNIPFGTAVGVYTMWVLLPGPSQQDYDTLVARRAA
jgi:hypothetical protein